MKSSAPLKLFICSTLVILSGVSRATEITVRPGESLVAARDAARAALVRGETSVCIRLLAGRHALGETLQLTAADSGHDTSPVIWEGEDGALISGGCELTTWTEDAPGVVSTPRAAAVETVWIGDTRAAASIFPKNGWISPADCSQEKSETGPLPLVERYAFTNVSARTLFAAIAPEDWSSIRLDARLKWSFATRRNLSLAPDGSTVIAHGEHPWTSWAKWDKAIRMTFSNVRAAFTEPGEWFDDRVAGRLRYRLRPGESASTLTATIPSGLSRLVSLEGAHDIVFRNLRFAHTGSSALEQFYNGQAASRMDGTVDGVNAVRVRWEDCSFAHTGNYAVRLRAGCVSNVISHCTFDDLGAGGIFLGSHTNALPSDIRERRAVVKNTDPRGNRFNRVEDCRITRGGQVNPEGVGVLLTQASDCTITHNEIDDFFYSGVSVGWTWGYSGSVAQRNEVSFNRISNLGKGWMDDLAGVYTLGTSFGTCVSNNVISHVRCVDYGGWGLYTDEGSEGIVMENNLITDTDDGSFHQHFGVGCQVRNNVFVGNRRDCAVRISNNLPSMGVPSTINLSGNIIVLDPDGPRFVNEPAFSITGLWAGNVWWRRGAPADFDGKGMDYTVFAERRREFGGCFVDPKLELTDGTFTLAPDSPARAVGFRPWDPATAGIRPYPTSR